MEAWKSRNEQRASTIEMLEKTRTEQADTRGGCVDAHVQEFRFAVTETLMGCGIPLNKLDRGLGKLLSRSCMTVGHSSDMKSYITLVRDKELKLLKE